MAKRNGRGPLGITNKNYKLGALALAVFIAATGSFALATGQIAVQPGSFLAAVFSILSNKPQIIITKNAASAASTTPSSSVSPLATFDVRVANVSYWATLRSLDISIAINDASTKSPLTLSNFTVDYKYCIPQGKTYGYYFQDAMKYGSCGTYSSTGTGAHKISILSADKTAEGYLLRVGFNQPIYPQQLPGTLTVYARPEYKPAADGSTVALSLQSSLRAAIIGGTGGGDQCKKYTSTIPYAYSQCYPRLTFVSVPVYGNVINVARESVKPNIQLAFVSASTVATQGPGPNDDLGTFTIRYKIIAIGQPAYISKLAAARLSVKTVGKTNAVSDRVGAATVGGTSVYLTNLTETDINAAGLYEIPAGGEVTFEVTTKMQLPKSGAAGQYRVRLGGVRWTNDPKDSTPDNSYAKGLDLFKTSYIGLN